MHNITRIKDQIADLQQQLRDEKADQASLFNMLSKEEKQKQAMELPSIDDQLWEDMRNYGFQTGSSVYSSKKNPADIDWVVPIPARAFIIQGCAVFCGVDHSDYLDETHDFQPLYANRDGILYNIICISDSNKFEAWKQATAIMKAIYQTYSGIDKAITEYKWKRVRIFRALTDILEPVKIRRSYEPEISLEDALKWHVCVTCGREAANFTCKAKRVHWETTGVCERCNP